MLYLQMALWLYAGPSVTDKACPTCVCVNPSDSRRNLNAFANSLISSRSMPSTMLLLVWLMRGSSVEKGRNSFLRLIPVQATNTACEQFLRNGQHFTHLATRQGDRRPLRNALRPMLSTPWVWVRGPTCDARRPSTARNGSVGQRARRRRNCWCPGWICDGVGSRDCLRYSGTRYWPQRKTMP